MSNAVEKIQHKLARVADEAAMALVNICDLLRRGKYLSVFALSLLLCLYLFTFFSDGTSKWQMLWSGLGLDRKIVILGENFAAILGNFSSWFGLAIILISIMQAIAIMLLVYAFRHREKDAALNGASTGGIASILSFLALGCPTCGVSFIAPILTAFAGAGALALTETLNYIFIALAFLLLIYTIIKLGYINYVTESAKKYKEKHGKNH